MAVRNPFTGISDGMRYLLRGPGSSRSSSSNIIPFPTEPPLRTSWVFDSHITQEAAGNGSGKGKHPQTISLAWDERDAWGLDLASRSWQGLTPQDRKAILLDIYINNPWVSACIDVIAKRICSGGFTVEKINEEAKDDQAHYDQLMEFCLRVNDDWDLLQYVRASLTSELIFGECYTEILWQGGLPWQLYNVDCLTMSYIPDRYGRIVEFQQQLTSTSEINHLDPKDIIRWWFPHPRASIDPFAPAEKVSDAVLIDKKMMNWMTTFFQKGARFSYYFKGVADENEADRFITYYKQNFTGEKNAHVPPVTWGNAEIAPLGNSGALEMDFQKGLDRMRTIVFAAYGVPPAAVSIIESGNIGGGTGEDQDKSLQYNACDPVRNAFFEKFNYRIVKQGFKIDDYRINTRYADYRNDKDLAQVTDIRIKNGTRTPDEARQEEGKQPYKKGGSVPFIFSTKEIVPLARLESMEDEQAQSAQLDIETKQIANEKAKNPPPPPPITPALLPGQQQQANADNKNVIKDGKNNEPKANTQGKASTGKQSGTNKSESATTFTAVADEDDTGLEDTLPMPAIRLAKMKKATQESNQPPQQPPPWEPPDIDKTLSLLKQKGVATQTWDATGGCVEICLLNHGATVKLGEAFPGGQRSVNGHPSCQCVGIYRDAEGNVIEVKEDEVKSV